MLKYIPFEGTASGRNMLTYTFCECSFGSHKVEKRLLHFYPFRNKILSGHSGNAKIVAISDAIF